MCCGSPGGGGCKTTSGEIMEISRVDKFSGRAMVRLIQMLILFGKDFPGKLDEIFAEQPLNHKAAKQEIHPKAFPSAHQGTEQLKCL